MHSSRRWKYGRMKVVLLFDDMHARTEAIQYAVELSSRMDSALVLLMLLDLDADGSSSVDENEYLRAIVEQAFAPHVRMARSAGVAVEPVLRIGNPYSELMKYLAETRMVHTIVWAGDLAVLSQRHRRESPHWLARMREAVEFPVVVPSLKP
jgi:hypothetical protein